MSYGFLHSFEGFRLQFISFHAIDLILKLSTIELMFRAVNFELLIANAK
jgi:hypothetical protein